MDDSVARLGSPNGSKNGAPKDLKASRNLNKTTTEIHFTPPFLAGSSDDCDFCCSCGFFSARTLFFFFLFFFFASSSVGMCAANGTDSAPVAMVMATTITSPMPFIVAFFHR